MRAAFDELLKHFYALFDDKTAQAWFVLVTALFLQISFWYWASPGPRLLNFESTELISALISIVWSLVLFLLVPGVLYLIFRVKAPGLGFAPGKVRFAPFAMVSLPVVVVLMFFVTQASVTQTLYPWAGRWVGSSPQTLFIWIALYALHIAALEFFLRGFLLRGLATHWGVGQALWIQALFATFMLLGGAFVELMLALPIALVLGVLALRSNTLLYSFLLSLTLAISRDVFVLYHQGLLFP